LLGDLQEFAEFCNRFHTVSSRDWRQPGFPGGCPQTAQKGCAWNWPPSSKGGRLRPLPFSKKVGAGVEPAPAGGMVTRWPPRPESVA
jgi:hypothetical protein